MTDKPKIESVEEFLKRGGKVKHVDFSKAYEPRQYFKKAIKAEAETKIQIKKKEND